MPRYLTLKYGSLLILFLCISMFMHYTWIAPMLEYLIIDDICSGMIQMLSLSIIEPVICIVIIVYMINRREQQYYDTLS